MVDTRGRSRHKEHSHSPMRSNNIALVVVATTLWNNPFLATGFSASSLLPSSLSFYASPTAMSRKRILHHDDSTLPRPLKLHNVGGQGLSRWHRRRADVAPHSSTPSSTALFSYIDVPYGFFTSTFIMLGLLLNISKKFARIRLEERAWEQRLDEARQERMRSDPTVTELDLRRREAAIEWSAFGTPRIEANEEAQRQQQQQQEELERRGTRRRRRVRVMDRDDDDDDDDDESDDNDVVDVNKYRMTDEEIKAFEKEYGVEYDPYYDDPYTEDELPTGKSRVDRVYGDRIYDDGEIFYRDAKTGLFYRQGSKPRSPSFWG